MTRRPRWKRTCLAALAALILPCVVLAQEATEKKDTQPEVKLPTDFNLRDIMTPAGRRGPLAPELIGEKEKMFASLERLTSEGDNGEAYFGPRGGRIIFQATMPGEEHDQIYVMNRDAEGIYMVSTGKGRATCSYFFPNGQRFIYASTHLREETPPKPAGGEYEWEFDEAFDLYIANFRGETIERLTDTPGYDAECTVSPSGETILWTSARDGDLEIYKMDMEERVPVRITNAKGYDGGAFFSPDETRIVYRASRTENYKNLEIYICDADGTNHRRITDNGAVNFAPYFHPSGERIIFSSNMDDPKNFELYMMKTDGTELMRITHSPGFDGFPHFSLDGRFLLFCSNRADPESGDTHIFVAEFRPYW
jgi:Tol biopolymer transport system component